MKHFLKTIIEEKKKEIALSKKRLSLNELTKALPNYKSNFKGAVSKSGLNIIAEIKKASPSRGVIVKNFNPQKIAKIYKKLNVSSISVLTERKFFKGDVCYLSEVKKIANLPVLRKDFIIDEYQIYESKFYKADAILLIARILTLKKLSKFLKIAKNLGLDCLVEIHSKQDLAKALNSGAEIVGINNRDLKTFRVDLNITEKLIKSIPKNKIIVSESGVKSREDLFFLKNLGVNAVLVGEAFLKAGSFKNIKKIIS